MGPPLQENPMPQAGPPAPPPVPMLPVSTPAQPRALLVTDFDGTLTRNDFYHIVVETFAPTGLAEHWQDYQTGRLTHFQALQAIFAAIRASEVDVLAALERTAPEPELGDWVAAL